jgi:uncharacterized membrane protein YfcA
LLSVVFLVSLAAASMQSSLGFGYTILGAPFLVLIEPRFIPGPALTIAGLLLVFVLLRDRSRARWGETAILTVGRAAGTVVGGVLLARFSVHGIAIFFAVSLVLAVIASIAGLRIRPTPPTMVGTGIVSGVMSTVAGLGGAPAALLFQHEEGGRLRAGMSAFLLPGTAMSLIAIAAAGRLGALELTLAAAMAPGAVVGYLLSSRITPIVDGRSLRTGVLAVTGLAGLTVLIRSLVTLL